MAINRTFRPFLIDMQWFLSYIGSHETRFALKCPLRARPSAKELPLQKGVESWKSG